MHIDSCIWSVNLSKLFRPRSNAWIRRHSVSVLSCGSVPNICDAHLGTLANAYNATVPYIVCCRHFLAKYPNLNTICSVFFVIISCYRKGDQNNLLKFAVFIHDGWRDLVLGTIESAARTYYACSLDFQMETHSASQ